MHIQIQSIALDKDVPVVKFSQSDGESATDSVFPGKDSQRLPAAVAFDEAVDALSSAMFKAVPELDAGDREWLLKSVTFAWDKEDNAYGYRIKLSGIQEGGPLLEMLAKETSPDQVDDRVYAALEKLRYEAERYVQGVSAQFNLLDGTIEIQEEAS